MLADLVQRARAPQRGFTAFFRHLGAFGLFFLAMLDSSPLPTFGGPDILIVILVATRRNPWYEYAAVATAGSVIGAYLTFRLARRAGMAYLRSKFGRGRGPKLLAVFERWGTGALAASTAIPFPFPTSVFFAAAGASNYDTRKYITVVTLCRAFRYAALGLVAEHYGRRMLRVLRHPGQYWGWLAGFALLILLVTAAGFMLQKRLGALPGEEWRERRAAS